MKPWVAKGKPLARKLGRTRRVGPPTKIFCILCKAHKGRYWTHNTPDCHNVSLSKKEEQNETVKDAYSQCKELGQALQKIKNVVELL